MRGPGVRKRHEVGGFVFPHPTGATWANKAYFV